MLSVAVWVGEARETAPTSSRLRCVDAGKVRGREATSLVAATPSHRVLDLPVARARPGALERAARADGRVVLAGGLGPENVRRDRRRPAVGGRRSLVARASPGVKDHGSCARYIEEARR